MGIELSPIKVLAYQIIESSYSVTDIDKAKNVPNNITFQFDYDKPTAKEDSEKIFRMNAFLRTAVEPDENEDECGCRIVVSVRGIFETDSSGVEISQEELEKFMRVNSYSLLYGFVRSHVQMITSMSPSGQVCLPCVDIASVAKELKPAKDETDGS